MAKCSKCGKPVGFFETICADCKAKEIEKQRRIEAERKARDEAKRKAQVERARREKEEKLQRLVFAVSDVIKKRLQTGQAVVLYETVYLPVDSVINEQVIGDPFEISTIMRLGLDGWEVIQTIPRTVGIGLANHQVGYSAGESWGGGVGGNIMGVYILLKKVLRNTDDLNQWGKLDSYIRNHINEFAG